jgi:predicted KAP-like P-loop ATPase
MTKRRFRKRATGSHPYSSDRPIRSKKNDVLGRAKFAARLADDIHSWEGEDSLVIALYGAWGSGKTSVKNMLLEANHKRGRKPLPVVDFNPWQLSGTGSIPASFFRELGLALKDEGPEREAEKRAKKWNAYAATLTLAGSAAEFVGKAMPLAGVPGGTILESLGAGMKSGGASAKEGSEALKAKSDAATNSLEDQKRELASLLARLPQPLLVVIDDIDRLTTDEILQVFQLVKANADFPRLIYLLLFEREVVAKALNQISGGKGTEFLEKIVQVGYHVPHASHAAVQKVLFTGLNKHLEDSAVSKHWDKHRWRDLYVDGVAGYFQNLRHVYRFMASFAFHFRHHRHADSIEVNPVDLIGLEVLRVFEPSVYERLPGAKSILTRYEGPSLFGEIKQETVDQALLQIISAAAPETQTRVRAILNLLFPPLASSYAGKHGVSGHHQKWLRELRICHPDLFDKYFTLTIADDDLSQSELDNLIVLTADAKGFVAACEALSKRGLLKITFDRLEAYKEHIPLQNMPTLIEALCNLGDSLPVRQPGFLETDTETHAFRLVYFGLKRESDTRKRFEVLRDAIVRSTGLALPVQLVSLEERVGDREARGLEFLVEEADLPELRRICVERLRAASRGRELRQNPRLQSFLWRWSEWTSIDEVRAWLGSHTECAKGAVWLLTVLLSEMHSWGGDHRVRYYIHLPTVERFADVNKLANLIQDMKEEGLSKKCAVAVREFKKALQRRAEGKSDEAWKTDGEYEVEELSN